MLIEQIIEFNLWEPGPFGRTCTPKMIIVKANQKFLMEDLWMDYYLLLKYSRRQFILFSLTCAKSLTKFNSKM